MVAGHGLVAEGRAVDPPSNDMTSVLDLQYRTVKTGIPLCHSPVQSIAHPGVKRAFLDSSRRDEEDSEVSFLEGGLFCAPNVYVKNTHIQLYRHQKYSGLIISHRI